MHLHAQSYRIETERLRRKERKRERQAELEALRDLLAARQERHRMLEGSR
jgi:hypothetical protein